MEIAELLLARGADVNAKTQNGTTPMHWAAIKDHKDVVEMLLQHGGINLGGVRPSDTWW
jgi:ankyrin repeat protein